MEPRHVVGVFTPIALRYKDILTKLYALDITLFKKMDYDEGKERIWQTFLLMTREYKGIQGEYTEYIGYMAPT